jgi:hypothetical protein
MYQGTIATPYRTPSLARTSREGRTRRLADASVRTGLVRPCCSTAKANRLQTLVRVLGSSEQGCPRSVVRDLVDQELKLDKHFVCHGQGSRQPLGSEVEFIARVVERGNEQLAGVSRDRQAVERTPKPGYRGHARSRCLWRTTAQGCRFPPELPARGGVDPWRSA